MKIFNEDKKFLCKSLKDKKVQSLSEDSISITEAIKRGL